MAGTEQKTLPRRSIFDMKWCEVRPDRLTRSSAELIRPGTEVTVLRTTTAGIAPIVYSEAVQPEDHTSAYAARFLQKTHHGWDASYLAVVNQPVLIDNRFGTFVIEDDGQPVVIAETVYAVGGNAVQVHPDNLLDDPMFWDAFESRSDVSDDERPAASLLNSKSPVYFHMLSEAALQTFVIAAAGLSDSVSFVTRRDRNGVAELAYSLAMSFGADVATTSRFVWRKRGIFYSSFHRHARLNPDFRRLVHHLKLLAANDMLTDSLGVWNLPPERGRRLYISRTSASARPLENETALIELVQEYGFDIVDPGRLPFREQVALFSGASCVLGPHGAGFTNAAFAQPGADVIEFRGLNRRIQSPSRNETYRRMSACMGLRYGCLMFDNPPGSDSWEIELDPVARVLGRLGR